MFNAIGPAKSSNTVRVGVMNVFCIVATFGAAIPLLFPSHSQSSPSIRMSPSQLVCNKSSVSTRISVSCHTHRVATPMFWPICQLCCVETRRTCPCIEVRGAYGKRVYRWEEVLLGSRLRMGQRHEQEAYNNVN
jgi:hypothetical protein